MNQTLRINIHSTTNKNVKKSPKYSTNNKWFDPLCRQKCQDLSSIKVSLNLPTEIHILYIYTILYTFIM